jgi:hypothetical protein
MEYLKLGMIIATILVPVTIYYLLKLKGIFSSELNNWWNGHKYHSELIPLEIVGILLICLVVFLVMSWAYPIFITGAIIAKVVILLRNKRLYK